MKKTLLTIFSVLSLMAEATAQTLNVNVGSVTDCYPATQTGAMTYTDGTQLNILNKAYSLSAITKMWTDETTVTDNQVNIVYNGAEASVYVAGNVARLLTVSVSGAHVSIVQSSDVAEEITYVLKGESTDGEFYMEGSYKATLDLQGLSLTNAKPVYSGAAIGIKNGKRIKLNIKKDTENTLTDSATSTLEQKGALYVKGHLELQGKGVLNVYGNYAHAIKAGEYIEVKNCTINVPQSVKDGVNCNQYFLMTSGTLNVSGVGDDGIQCDIDTDSQATAETDGHENENTGNIYLEGGTLNIAITAAGAKGIKAENDLTISGGSITVNNTGRNGEGIEAKGQLNITNGEVTVNAYDDAINSGSHMTISGGLVYARATNNDGLDANGNLYVKGGLVYAIGASSPEVALDANTERGYKLYIQGGTIIAIGGLERGSSLTQSCYQASSWNRNSWYALTVGGTTVAFKTPSSGGSGLVVSGSSTPTLKSGVSASGTPIFGGVAYTEATVSGGNNVTLSSYSSNSGGGPGGGGPGGRW